MYTTQLTPEQIAEARAFINSQYAPYTFDNAGITDPNWQGSGVATGRDTWDFNGDFSGGWDGQKVLGAQQAMGISDPNMASILGMAPDQFSSWAGGVPSVYTDIAAGSFAHDFPGLVPDAAPAAPATPSMGGGGGRSNPYLGGMADAMGQKWTNTLNDQWLPAIRDNSVAAGGLGGSRQGVAQGLAIGRAGEGYAGQLAGLYGGAWENEQNRGLQQQSIDNSFYTAQRGQDLSQFGLGLEAWNLGMNGPWTGLNNAGSIYGGVGSQNSTSTGSTSGGGGAQGALGGGLLGWGLWNNLNKMGG